MINIRRGLLLLVVSCVLGPLMGACSAQDVVVDVTVSSGGGAPIDGLVVTVFGDAVEWHEDITDAQGLVQLTIARPLVHDSLVVGLMAPSFERQGGEVWPEWESRRRELLHEYSSEGLYVIDLEEGVSQYPLSIVLNDATTISGRVLVDGQPTATGVALLGAQRGYLSDRDSGDFVVGGVEAGERAALVFVLGSGQRELRWFDGTQTQSDFSIGDVHLAPRLADGRLDLDVVDWEQLDLRGRLGAPTMLLVRDDGLFAMSLKVDSGGRARAFRSVSEDLWVPAGTYYLATGPEGPDPVANRLIRLVHEGVVDLDAAGVTKIVVTAGQVTSVQVSAPAVETAVVNAGG